MSAQEIIAELPRLSRQELRDVARKISEIAASTPDAAPPAPSRLDRLVKRSCIVGDPEQLVHMDWSCEWNHDVS